MTRVLIYGAVLSLIAIIVAISSSTATRRKSLSTLATKLHVPADEMLDWMELGEDENGSDELDEELEQYMNEKEEDNSPVQSFWEWAKMVARGQKPRQQQQQQRRQPMRRVQKTAETTRFPTPRPINTRRGGARPRRPANIRRDAPPCLRRTDVPFREHRTYPRSWEHPGFAASLPRQWDWRNVSGINYCSPNRNQHIPVYCGGCWVFGTLGALQDRFNIARNNRWPMVQLSPQEIIACNGRGNCTAGGTAQDVFDHAKVNGLVEEGCNNYKAVNEKCTPFTRCGSCWPDCCFAIHNYTRYYIKDYGTLSGREAMMSEIHNRGPIACQIGATENFDLNYTGGIFQELIDAPTNHIVAVSGWGWDEDTKTEYWIVRNSWGDAWGEMGWFRIVTSLYRGGRGDQYNLGIERQCYFADPDISNLNF